MNANQPAFPTAPSQIWNGDTDQQVGEVAGKPGFSAREELAARAMAALIVAYGQQGHTLSKMPAEIADVATDYADALIAELNKEEK